MKCISKLIIGLLIGAMLGLWFGINIGRERPLLSNPFRKESIPMKNSGKQAGACLTLLVMR